METCEVYRALIQRAGVPSMPHRVGDGLYNTWTNASAWTFLDNLERIGENDLIGQSIRVWAAALGQKTWRTSIDESFQSFPTITHLCINCQSFSSGVRIDGYKRCANKNNLSIVSGRAIVPISWWTRKLEHPSPSKWNHRRFTGQDHNVGVYSGFICGVPQINNNRCHLFPINDTVWGIICVMANTSLGTNHPTRWNHTYSPIGALICCWHLRSEKGTCGCQLDTKKVAKTILSYPKSRV